MSTISLSTIYDTLEPILDNIVDDKTKGSEASADFRKWMKVQGMDKYEETDLEMGGPGYASEFGESVEVPTGTIYEGTIWRYTARKFGMKLIITEEAVQDTKYKEAINLTGRLVRALWKTADVDSTNVLVRATDSNYVADDGVVLASASHPLPNGGTYSNLMGTPISPSVAGVSIARAACRKLVGHDGTPEGYQLKKVLFPVEQESSWETLVLSDKAPESGNFAKINIVKRMSLEPVPLKFWGNTTTNYTFLTDCDYQPNFRWRLRPTNRSWMENGNQVMFYSHHARWDNGYSDARAFYFVNA